MDSSTSSSNWRPRLAAVLTDRATQVVLAVFLCFGAYAIVRPDLHHVVGKADHHRFVAGKLLTPPHSAALVIAGNSRPLFGIQCGRFESDQLPRSAINLGIPALRYTKRYLDFVDRSLTTEGVRIVILCLGESNFRAREPSTGFEYYEENGAALRATPSDARGRRLAPLPVAALAEAWGSGDLAKIDADRRIRFEGGSFRVDGSAVVDLPDGDSGEPHDVPPDDLNSRARADGRRGLNSDGLDSAAFVDASLDPSMAKELLDTVHRWRESGVVVTFLRMPDRSDGEEEQEQVAPDTPPSQRTAAFAELGRALRMAGAVELAPSFDGLRTWDGVHMDGASAAIFTARVEDALRRVMEQRAERGPGQTAP